MPNHYCLALLELNGIGFSTAAYETQKQVMQAKLTEIETKAYQLAGHSFSLTSPDDIAEVCENSDGRWSTFQKISSRCFSLHWMKNSHGKTLYEEGTLVRVYLSVLIYELAACKVLCIFCLIVIVMISAKFCRMKEVEMKWKWTCCLYRTWLLMKHEITCQSKSFWIILG